MLQSWLESQYLYRTRAPLNITVIRNTIKFRYQSICYWILSKILIIIRVNSLFSKVLPFNYSRKQLITTLIRKVPKTGPGIRIGRKLLIINLFLTLIIGPHIRIPYWKILGNNQLMVIRWNILFFYSPGFWRITISPYKGLHQISNQIQQRWSIRAIGYSGANRSDRRGDISCSLEVQGKYCVYYRSH